MKISKLNLLTYRSIVAAAMLATFAWNCESRTVALNIRAKGNGSIYLTINGTTKSFHYGTNTSTTEWELSSGLPQYFNVDDEVDYVATITTSNISDYVIFQDSNPGNAGGEYRETHELLMNGAAVDSLPKSLVIGSIFSVRSANKTGVPFGKVDLRYPHLSRSIRFGLDAGGARGAGGYALLKLPSLTKSSAASMKFYAGAKSGLMFQDSSRIQAYSDAGFIDIVIAGGDYTVRFYKREHGPSNPGPISQAYGFNSVNAISTYFVDFTSISGDPYTPPYIPNAHPPATTVWTSGRQCAITRTIGSDSRVLELRTDYYYGYTWDDGGSPVPDDDVKISWDDSVTRVWPWRKTSQSFKGGLSEYWASAIGWAFYPNYSQPSMRSHIFTETRKYEGSTSSSTLLEFAEGTYSYEKHGIESGPKDNFRGSGTDRHPVPSRLANAFGGRYSYEYYRGSSLSPYHVGNLEGEPLESAGMPKYMRKSYQDDSVTAASAIVTKYNYQSVLGGTQVEPVLVVATKDSKTISKSSSSYSETTFQGQLALVQTRSDFSSSSNPVVTVVKMYANIVANPDLRGQIISVVRPDGSKSSYGISRGNWSPGVWTTDAANGKYVRYVTVNGKLGAGVSSFDGTNIDAVELEIKTAPGWLIGRNTAEVKVTDAQQNVVFEGVYAYTAVGFKLVEHKYYDYDDNGQLTRTYERAGDTAAGGVSRIFQEAGYTGLLKTWEADAQGVKTNYDYDDYGRPIISTVEAFGGQGDRGTTYQYDGAGRIVKRMVEADPGLLTTAYTYDSAGRLKTVTDAAGVITQIDRNYATNTTSVRVSPTGGDYTTVATIWKDGTVKSVTGSAVPDRAYAYSYLSDGRYQKTETYSVGKWVTTVDDWLGRIDYVKEPTQDGGSRYAYKYYNSSGQLYKEEVKNDAGTFLSPRKLYKYDVYGRLSYEAFDSDMDGVIDFDTDAGVARRYSHYQKATTGGIWELYEVALDYVYDNSSADRHVSQVYTQLADFSSPNTLSKVRFNDSNGNWTTLETTVDRWQRAMTKRATVPGQMYDSLESYSNGLLLSASDSVGNTTDFGYDSSGRLIMQVDPRMGPIHSTTFEYYPNSTQLKSVTNPDGTTVGYVYNGLNGRMIHQTFAPSDGSPVQNTRYAYDAAGNPIRVWSSAANPVKFVYNDLNQLTEMYTYRSGSNWSGTNLPAEFDTLPGDKTTWNYHASTSLLLSKRDASNKGNTFAYDDLDRVATRTDGRGVVTSYAYYDYVYYGAKQFTGMLRQVSYNTSADPSTVATPTVSYAYRRGLGLDTVTDAVGIRTFEYFDDPMAGYFAKGSSMLPRSETLAPFYFSKQIEYDYQFGPSGQLSGVRNRLQFDALWQYNVMFEYNDINRLSAVVPAHSSMAGFDYAYTPNSNLVQSIERTGNRRTYSYEPFSNRLDRVVSDVGYGFTQLADVMPHYDGYGRLFYTETLGDVVTGLGTYGSYGAMQYQTYTDRNEIDLSVKHQVSTPSAYPSDNGLWGAVIAKNNSENGYRNYDYDPIGNRTLEDEHANASYGNQTPIAANSLNQYATYANKSYTYDNNGNLKSDGVRSFTYDAENNLVDVSPISPTTGDLRYFNQYDYLGRRVLKRVWEWSGAWTLRQDLSSRLVYDGWNLIAELDDNGNVKKKYTWGNDVSGTAQGAGGVGGLLLIELANGPGFEQIYPIYDSRHNIIGLHDGAGAVVARYDYDAFGEVFSVNGSAYSGYGDTNYAEANPFRFSSKYTDNYSTKFGDGDAYRDGMIYYGLRFYVPETGRFLNRDPIEESGGLNLYGFVGNDPTNAWDLLGLSERNLFVVDDPWNTSVLYDAGANPHRVTGEDKVITEIDPDSGDKYYVIDYGESRWKSDPWGMAMNEQFWSDYGARSSDWHPPMLAPEGESTALAGVGVLTLAIPLAEEAVVGAGASLAPELVVGPPAIVTAGVGITITATGTTSAWFRNYEDGYTTVPGPIVLFGNPSIPLLDMSNTMPMGFESRQTGRQRDTGLQHLSDQEIMDGARSGSKEQRRRYQREEKARDLRNKGKSRGKKQ